MNPTMAEQYQLYGYGQDLAMKATALGFGKITQEQFDANAFGTSTRISNLWDAINATGKISGGSGSNGEMPNRGVMLTNGQEVLTSTAGMPGNNKVLGMAVIAGAIGLGYFALNGGGGRSRRRRK